MDFISNDDVLDIIRIALDADLDNPIHEIEEVDNIIYDPNDLISGELGVRVQDVNDLQYIKFIITETAVQIFKEITTIGEDGKIESSVFFFPIYNIIELAEILSNISPKSQI